MKKKLSEQIEDRLINEILSGKYRPGDAIPFERELAVQLNVGRPTLREAIQRLERDGFLRVKKGSPTIVNDYWKKGNLNVLVKIVEICKELPEDFILYILELRIAILPLLVSEVVKNSPHLLVGFLADIENIEDSSRAYASYDWDLQKKLAELSKNPIFTLLFNSFDKVYVEMALPYFSYEKNRDLSRIYFADLLTTSMEKNYKKAEIITTKMMQDSIGLWKKAKNGDIK